MSHSAFIASIASSVRDAGAVATLDTLRRTHPTMFGTDGAPIAYHDTLAVFSVWAVDRLIAAGLTDSRILWHPLTDVRTPLAWWDADTLATIEAIAGFVPSTKALPNEPAPFEPRVLLAA